MAIDYTKRPSKTPPAGGPSPAGPGPAGGGVPPGGVSLSKVTLTKSAPTVSLNKQGAGGNLRVNLNWNARPGGGQAEAPKGFFKRMAAAATSGIDLDLGALYEYTDGSKGVVQAIGNSFRDIHTFGPKPIVFLDGDDRSGSNSGGENLHVDLSQAAHIKRILVFAFIYEGVPNWAEAKGVVTLFPASGPQVEILLDDHDPRSIMCAIAMLENVGGQISVRREVRYVQGGQRALDEAFGWGMRWTAGSK